MGRVIDLILDYNEAQLRLSESLKTLSSLISTEPDKPSRVTEAPASSSTISDRQNDLSTEPTAKSVPQEKKSPDSENTIQKRTSKPAENQPSKQSSSKKTNMTQGSDQESTVVRSMDTSEVPLGKGSQSKGIDPSTSQVKEGSQPPVSTETVSRNLTKNASTGSINSLRPSTSIFLSIRQPNGETLRSSFPLDATLDDVCQYIEANRTDGNQSYGLYEIYPRRELIQSNQRRGKGTARLTDLGFAHSGSLIMVPLSTSTNRLSPMALIGSFFGLFVMVVVQTVTFLKSLLTFKSSNAPSAKPESTPVPPLSPTQRKQNDHIRQRRLRTLGDLDRTSNDSENRMQYNGNSTNQE